MNQTTDIVIYRSQYEYRFQNDVDVQEAWIEFMGAVVLIIALFVAVQLVKDKVKRKRNGR